MRPDPKESINPQSKFQEKVNTKPSSTSTNMYYGNNFAPTSAFSSSSSSLDLDLIHSPLTNEHGVTTKLSSTQPKHQTVESVKSSKSNRQPSPLMNSNVANAAQNTGVYGAVYSGVPVYEMMCRNVV